MRIFQVRMDHIGVIGYYILLWISTYEGVEADVMMGGAVSTAF